MEAAVLEIRPNIKKAFISNILMVSVIVALIIGTMIFLNNVVGLGVFLEVFSQFGVEVSTSSVLMWFIILVFLFTALLLFLNYASLGKVRYTLYPDKLVYSKSFFIFEVDDKEIPYANIAKISYEKKSFLDASKVIVDLTSMKEDKLEMDFIDDAEEVVGKMQGFIRSYKARYYAQYSQDYKYQNIMEKL